jgi:MFS family permease
LRVRDFALVWVGMSVSLLGDGIYLVAIAWQVYTLDNRPTALALVGAAWMIPQVLLLLVGGAISDRFDRRIILMLSDVVRGAAIAGLGLLSVTGAIQMWQVFALVGLYGAGAAVFTPSFTGIVRDIVPRELLLEANSLGQLVRPIAVRFVGPLLGGVLIAAFSVGAAFLVDAGSFAFSATAFLLVRTRLLRDASQKRRSLRHDIGAGIGYVRSQTWLWTTMVAITVTNLLFTGPVYVLMPYVVKNTLDGGAQGLGFVLAAGGVGAVGASLLLGNRGLPARPLAFVYSVWAISTISLVGYALAGQVWEAMLVSFVSVGGLVAGGVVWTTLLQKLVPQNIIGRVSSLDWLLTLGLTPVSYALTGPVAAVVGVEPTLVAAGLSATAVLLLVLVVVPSVRTSAALNAPAVAA